MGFAGGANLRSAAVALQREPRSRFGYLAAPMTPAAPPTELAAALPGWWPEALLWLGLGVLVALVVAALGIWTLVARLRSLREDARSLETLGELKRSLDRLLAGREELDLRRIEHLLIDLRDGARRLEDGILRLHESQPVESDALRPARAPALGERIVNRLLALGYERVELLVAPEALAQLDRGDGQVIVEARREGVLHKGRVVLHAGRIDAVHLQPAFPLFP